MNSSQRDNFGYIAQNKSICFIKVMPHLHRRSSNHSPKLSIYKTRNNQNRTPFEIVLNHFILLWIYYFRTKIKPVISYFLTILFIKSIDYLLIRRRNLFIPYPRLFPREGIRSRIKFKKAHTIRIYIIDH